MDNEFVLVTMPNNKDAALTEVEDAPLVLAKHFHLYPVGLFVRGNPDFEEWAEACKHLQFIHRSIHWWMGDLLRLGQHVWGEKYAQALEETPFEYQTLANDVWVATAIDFTRRREQLSFGHHAEVAAREHQEQDLLLDMAEEFGWSVDLLKDRHRRFKDLRERDWVLEEIEDELRRYEKVPQLTDGRQQAPPTVPGPAWTLRVTGEHVEFVRGWVGVDWENSEFVEEFITDLVTRLWEDGSLTVQGWGGIGDKILEGEGQ